MFRNQIKLKAMLPLMLLGVSVVLASCGQREKSVSNYGQKKETEASFGQSTSSEPTNQSTEVPKVSDQKTQSDTLKYMDEVGVDRGDYSSLMGYWEADIGDDVLLVTENGLMKESPGFKELKTGETRKLEDIHETELTRLRAEDNHLMDVVTTSRGSRIIMYKYVPKGTQYSPTTFPGDASGYLTAEEDMIMTAMNGTDGVYHIYRRSKYGEAMAIIDTHISSAGLLFSVPNEIVLPASSEPINIHQFDMGDIVDYYNTHKKEVYSLEMVLNDLGAVQRRNGRASDLSVQELEELKKNRTEMSWIYFEGDHQLLLAQGVTGHVGPSPKIAPTSDWLFEGEMIKVPLLNTDNSPYGEIILKENNKSYEGGRKKSSYYVYEFTIGN